MTIPGADVGTQFHAKAPPKPSCPQMYPSGRKGEKGLENPARSIFITPRPYQNPGPRFAGTQDCIFCNVDVPPWKSLPLESADMNFSRSGQGPRSHSVFPFGCFNIPLGISKGPPYPGQQRGPPFTNYVDIKFPGCLLPLELPM